MFGAVSGGLSVIQFRAEFFSVFVVVVTLCISVNRCAASPL